MPQYFILFYFYLILVFILLMMFFLSFFLFILFSNLALIYFLSFCFYTIFDPYCLSFKLFYHWRFYFDVSSWFLFYRVILFHDLSSIKFNFFLRRLLKNDFFSKFIIWHFVIRPLSSLFVQFFFFVELS
jgi:hypothetical protein